MFAFDLSVAAAQEHHPDADRQSYQDIRATQNEFGIERVQGSAYVAKEKDLAKLFLAVDALRKLQWVRPSLKRLRALRMQQGSDLTGIVKGQ